MKSPTFVTAQPIAPESRSRRQLMQTGLTVALNVALPAHAEISIKATIQRAAINAPVASIYSSGESAWAVTTTGRLWERVANAWRSISTAPALETLKRRYYSRTGD